MIALIDGVELGVHDAKRVLVDAVRWLLAGAAAEVEGGAPVG